ncbi:single-stranded-DNA-specific exonuclease RecJ [Aestuariibacter halophilus]|uniref:Single-stranded-DNA-specific exonuclease RecJ n=1 Tax=Fluctibacter halophilus TaxID=226011 RepID=A0ABS8GF20_9ALTE|nr:single-stranded-DNA-specific exonuclease RecJ [Aestuariibacter halophilus]MCC2617791.1 single-stranded-DNA-specific exonuclease RecJ [Aestuariibacter halophilus]
MPLEIVRRPAQDAGHLTSVEHPLLRQILANRGVQDNQQLDLSAQQLVHFDRLRGIDVAVELLADAIARQQHIIVIGDFDADGATSVALVMLALTQMGSKKHSYLVPNRFDFGYGLSPEIVDVAAQQGANLIMTVDNGIACHAGVERARQQGIDVIVTDHHLPGDSVPDAAAIVNPNQPGCEFPSKALAGVGVAFYVMLALRHALKGRDWFSQNSIAVPNLADLLDIVALGTVADVVPLDHNNRVLVYQGLQRIRSGRCRPGIRAMLEVARKSLARIQSSDLGFVLGPRLNAAGRLDDMSLGIECLLSPNEGVAREMAVQLDSLNRERREIESSMQAQAIEQLEQLVLDESDLPYGMVLYQPDFHQGVIGILAGRIKDRYHRPTIAFAHQDDMTLKGSARSVEGLHIRDVLDEIDRRQPGLMDKFGGHAMAAGLSLPVAHLEAFQTLFNRTVEQWMAGKPLHGQVLSDGELPALDMTLDFAQQLQALGPWGQQFPEPRFDGTFTLLEQRIVGQKHLKMLLKQPDGKLLDAIAFNVDLSRWPDPTRQQARMAYKLDINEFRGRISVQLLVEALEPA